jgi:hypothetical protein
MGGLVVSGGFEMIMTKRALQTGRRGYAVGWMQLESVGDNKLRQSRNYLYIISFFGVL